MPEEGVISIPISKGKELTIEVDWNALSDALPPDVYKEVIYQGLKQVLNRGMTKLASSKKMTGKHFDDAQAALLAAAEANVEKCKAGEIRVTGGKAKTKKLDRAIQTEAMRLARQLIKDQLKANNKRISDYTAKAISAAAKEFLETHAAAQEVWDKAKATVEAREKPTAEVVGIDVSALKPDPAMIAKNEAKKATSKKTTVDVAIAPKAKPAAQHATTH